MGENNNPDCMNLLHAALEAIRAEMSRNYWNSHQAMFFGSGDDPFDNTGAKWSNDVFAVKAYDWNENQEPNFAWQNVKVWWYKYLGRGMACEVDGGKADLTPDLINQLLNDCLQSLEECDHEKEE